MIPHTTSKRPFPSTPAELTKPKILVYCPNLHAGGGVAVATSLVAEFSRIADCYERMTVWASSEITGSLTELGCEVDNFADFHTQDVRGARALYARKPASFSEFDVVFTVFGPMYVPVIGARNVVGFAQAWVAYPHNSAYSVLSRSDRLRSRVKYQIQNVLFSAADVLVVEHEHVRRALKEQRRFHDKRIEVVPNTVDSVILDRSRWKWVQLPPKRAALRLGVVSRNYPHKNLAILPRVHDVLRDEYELDVEFVVTFPSEDYEGCSDEFRACVRNAGPLQLAQSPAFNAQLDGVVFPTLLECFSATPIEAFATRTPLFASDRPFVRDTVGGHGVFFDPLDPRDIAHSIARYFERPHDERARELDQAQEYVVQGGYGARDRALTVMQILDEQLPREAAT